MASRVVSRRVRGGYTVQAQLVSSQGRLLKWLCLHYRRRKLIDRLGQLTVDWRKRVRSPRQVVRPGRKQKAKVNGPRCTVSRKVCACKRSEESWVITAAALRSLRWNYSWPRRQTPLVHHCVSLARGPSKKKALMRPQQWK